MVRRFLQTLTIALQTKDLDISEAHFGVAVSVFSATYIVYALLRVLAFNLCCSGQIPANYLMKRLPINIFFVCTALAMGLVTSTISLVSGYPGLVAARLALGFAEAGTMSGCLLLLSQFFRHEEMASKIAITTYVCAFCVLHSSLRSAAASCANISGSLMAYGLLQLDKVGGLHGWQWWVLVVSLCCYFERVLL